MLGKYLRRLDFLFRFLWWTVLRGVGMAEYWSVCSRCGCSGQAHIWFLPSSCLRFRR
jgi:hypothetical protein